MLRSVFPSHSVSYSVSHGLTEPGAHLLGKTTWQQASRSLPFLPLECREGSACSSCYGYCGSRFSL